MFWGQKSICGGEKLILNMKISNPVHEKSILEKEHGFLEPPGTSPNTKNLENDPNTKENKKNSKI